MHGPTTTPQRKICMLGAFAVGKTSLVRRYVHSTFSERYHTTVGVKIDRTIVPLDDTRVTLLLWDIAGEDDFQRVRPTYLRGSHGLILVMDGTRVETLDVARELRRMAEDAIGPVPAVLALNKTDLADRWELDPDVERRLRDEPWHPLRSSARTGDGVEQAFTWLARAAAHG